MTTNNNCNNMPTMTFSIILVSTTLKVTTMIAQMSINSFKYDRFKDIGQETTNTCVGDALAKHFFKMLFQESLKCTMELASLSDLISSNTSILSKSIKSVRSPNKRKYPPIITSSYCSGYDVPSTIFGAGEEGGSSPHYC